VKDKKLKRVLGEREASYDRATLSAARGEILLSSHVGYVFTPMRGRDIYDTFLRFLEAEDDMEKTYKVSQREISQSTDLNTSKKVCYLGY